MRLAPVGSHARRAGERRWLTALAWAASLAALLASAWLVWRSARSDRSPPPNPVVVVATPPSAGPPEALQEPMQPEMTQQERQTLDEILRRKGGGQR